MHVRIKESYAKLEPVAVCTEDTNNGHSKCRSESGEPERTHRGL